MALDEQLVRYAKDLARVYAAREEAEAAWTGVLVRLLETRLPLLKGHHRRVAYWSDHLNRALGQPLPAKVLSRVAGLHDLGFLAIPDAVIAAWGQAASENRDPDPETKRRFLAHAEIGAEILAGLPGLAEAADWVRHHHEAWDGSGGPLGIAGAAIPLGARVLAVAEVFDYLTQMQERLSIPAARERLAELAGRRLDPTLVETFQELPLESLFENYLWLEAHEGLGD